MTTYTRKAFFGMAWVATGAVLANVFGYLLRLILARNLTVTEYGLVYSIIAFFGLCSILQHLGIGEAVARYIATAMADERKRDVRGLIAWGAIIILISSTIVSGAVWLAAGWLGEHYFSDPAAATLVRVYAIGFFLGGLNVITLAAVHGMQRMRLYSIYTTTQQLILLLATGGLLLLGFGASAAIYAYIILYLSMYAIFLPIILKGLPRGKARLDETVVPKMLLAYGLPVILAGLGTLVLTYTDTAILTALSTLEEVAAYQAAMPTANILLFAVGVLATILFPIVAECWQKGQRQLITQAVREVHTYAVMLLLPFIAAVIAYPDLILNLLFGQQYVSAAPILVVLAIAAVVLTLNIVNTTTLAGMGMPALTARALFAGAGVNAVANLLLIPRLGAVGAALGTLIAAVVIFAMSVIMLRRAVRVELPLGPWLRIAAAGLIMPLVLIVARTLPIDQYVKMALGVAVGMVLYVIALFVLRAVTVEDLEGLRRRIAGGKG